MKDIADNPKVAVFPPLLFGVALLAVIALYWLWPLAMPARTISIALGLVLMVLGAGLGAWGRRTMVSAGTNVNPSLPTIALVSAGPFQFTRNPLYLALLLIFAGLSFVLGTWWGVIVLVPTILVLHYGVILREERYLEQKFGETYLQYKGRVRRYL